MISTRRPSTFHRWWVGAMALALTVLPSRLWADAPQGVSPGSVTIGERLANACPTFSWSEVDGATGYELIVYRIQDSGELAPVVEQRVPRGASGWTPSAAECPASGSHYAWAVRALAEDGAGAWSEPLLFATAGPPSDDEVRQALDVLRRYQRERVAEEADDPIAAGSLLSTPTDRDLLDRPQGVGPLGTTVDGVGGASTAGLTSGTVGAEPSPRVVVAPPSFSLSLDGDVDLGGFVFKDGAPFIHNDGGETFRNTAGGLYALISATPGDPDPTSGSDNAAFGFEALKNNTSALRNTAIGSQALKYTTAGSGNTAVGTRALRNNSTGFSNTALGDRALRSNSAGNFNTATGVAALYSSNTGSYNTANGYRALVNNTNASRNTAVGSRALHNNSDGSSNTANGFRALVNNTGGHRNTAIGSDALYSNTTGSHNLAIGESAGFDNATGSNNIYLGHGAYGSTSDAGVIRIGGFGFQSKTYIEGISGAMGDFTADVCIQGSNQLGPCGASSARFKQDVRPLGDLPRGFFALRPVSFRYREEFSGEEEPTLRYGLIAEEVAAVFPSLVGYDDEGRPQTVRYDLLTPLLLGEIQHQKNELEDLRQAVAGLRRSAPRRVRPGLVREP